MLYLADAQIAVHPTTHSGKVPTRCDQRRELWDRNCLVQTSTKMSQTGQTRSMPSTRQCQKWSLQLSTRSNKREIVFLQAPGRVREQVRRQVCRSNSNRGRQQRPHFRGNQGKYTPRNKQINGPFSVGPVGDTEPSGVPLRITTGYSVLFKGIA